MPTFPKMTANTLNAKYGWPSQSAVQFPIQLDATVATVLPAGSVGHVSASGTLIPGVGNNLCMPLFTFSSSNAPDVQNYGGNPTSEAGVWVSISPAASGGRLLTLTGNGAYELVSTNFDTTVSYAPNDCLTSPLTTTGSVTPGMLTKGTYGTNMIVGIVSRGVINNGYGTNAISFWPMVLPA